VRAPEEPTRRHLNEREVVAAGECESGCVVLGKALAQRAAQGRQGKGLRAQQRPRPGQHGRQVDIHEGRTNLGMGGELAVEDGPEERPEREAVVSRQQVDRAANRCDPDDLAFDQEPPQFGCGERVEPRPEPGVRVRRHLRLQPDEMVHCFE
jgi:hypothetical protein